MYLRGAILSLFTLIMVTINPQQSALYCCGYDLTAPNNKELVEMIRSVAYIPEVFMGDSHRARNIALASFMSACATATKLIRELLHKPDTAVWRQLVVNVPMVLVSCVHLVFDVSRLTHASMIAEQNKTLPQKDFVVHQAFCLFMEFFLRGCAWSAEHSKNGADHVDATRLSLAANLVEQWRLNTRWFRLPSGISQQQVKALGAKLFGRELLCPQ